MSMKKLILDAVEARKRYDTATELAKMATDEQSRRKGELEKAEWAISEKADADFKADPQGKRWLNSTYIAKDKDGKTHVARIWHESGRGTYVRLFSATEVEE